MTKKDYELIASAVYNAMQHSDETTQVCIKMLATLLSDTLASKNPRFSKEKFLRACGVELYKEHDLYCYIRKGLKCNCLQ